VKGKGHLVTFGVRKWDITNIENEMDSALQLIMGQFKELKSELSTSMVELKTDMCALGTEQEALRSDICAELKSDMSKIRADLMTQVHAMENKMGNSMSAIREELETQISDLCAGQTELEERLEKQQKNVASMVEQQARSLREKFEAQLAAVEARSRRAGGGGPGAGTTTVKPPKFEGATSWAVFHRQFEAAAVQNNWMLSEKAAHLLSVLHDKAADILHTVPAKATYEDIMESLRDRFGDHQLAAAYQSQLKARVQKSGETLQEFAAAVEQLAYRALVGLPVAFIQTEATHSFIDGIRDREVKQHLLMGGDWTLNEALNQALKLEATKAAAGPPARLRKLTGASARVSQPPDRRREGRPLCWQCGSADHLRRDCRREPREDRTRETSKCQWEEGPTSITTLNPSIYAKYSRSGDA